MSKLIILPIIFTLISCMQCGTVPSHRSLKPLEPSEEYTYSLIVDEDEPEVYQLFWKLVDNDEYIQFEVHCQSTGWVGFGLSPNGDMPGADIAIGWVDDNDGKAHLRDTHAVSRSAPKVDPVQDWKLIEGAQSNGYTMLKFKRPLKSCDTEHDIEIKKETNYLIFAWNPKDPVNDNWEYHGKNRRIAVDMLLNYKPKDENSESLIQESEHAEKIDFRLNNIPIKKQGTYYYCQVFAVPPSSSDRHMIRYEVLPTKGNKDIFHHMILHECEDFIDFSSNPNIGHECGTVMPPPQIARCLGSKIVALWSVGGRTSFYFPRDTGYPIYANNKPKYYLIEYHFDFLELSNERRDSSGMRLYLTPNLRKHEVGILSVGSGSTYLDLQMPPKINDIMFSSICPSDCFDKFVPNDGITVFSGYLHTHLAGRAVSTKLVRNNEIVQNLFENEKYDFNYQFSIEPEPFKLKKGDSLITECHYNTMDREKFSFWGFSTQDEMCYNFIFFYPIMPDFTFCQSIPTVASMEKFYSSLIADGLLPPQVTSNKTDVWEYGGEVYEVLKDVTNFSDELRKRYVDFYKKPSEHVMLCGASDYSDEMIIKEISPFPNPPNVIKEEVRECKKPSGNSASRLFNVDKLTQSMFVLLTAIVSFHFSN